MATPGFYVPSDFKYDWTLPEEDVWKRAFYQGLPDWTTGGGGQAGAFGSQLRGMATRGMAPAYGGYLLATGGPDRVGTPTSFADYMAGPGGTWGGTTPARSPVYDRDLGWNQMLDLSRLAGTGDVPGWADVVESNPYAGMFTTGEGDIAGMSPESARMVALARMAPQGAGEYASWSQGMRGNLAARAIQNLQNIYEQAQYRGKEGSPISLMGANVSPYGMGGEGAGFLSWLSDAMGGATGSAFARTV
jgi:hypothetical protein